MHSCRMRTGRSLTICWGGASFRGAPSGGVPPSRECLLLGGSPSWGSLLPGGVSFQGGASFWGVPPSGRSPSRWCLLPRGVSQHALGTKLFKHEKENRSQTSIHTTPQSFQSVTLPLPNSKLLSSNTRIEIKRTWFTNNDSTVKLNGIQGVD